MNTSVFLGTKLKVEVWRNNFLRHSIKHSVLGQAAGIFWESDLVVRPIMCSNRNPDCQHLFEGLVHWEIYEVYLYWSQSCKVTVFEMHVYLYLYINWGELTYKNVPFHLWKCFWKTCYTPVNLLLDANFVIHKWFSSRSECYNSLKGSYHTYLI